MPDVSGSPARVWFTGMAAKPSEVQAQQTDPRRSDSPLDPTDSPLDPPFAATGTLTRAGLAPEPGLDALPPMRC